MKRICCIISLFVLCLTFNQAHAQRCLPGMKGLQVTGGMADGYTQPPTGYDCPSTLDSDYLRLLYRLGQEHLYTDGRTRQQFLGTITGVQPGGELEVRHSADGQLRKYLFKEIEYVIGTPEP